MNRIRSRNPLSRALNTIHTRHTTRTLLLTSIAILAASGGARALPDGVRDVVPAADGVGFVLALPESAQPTVVRRDGEPPAIEIAGVPSFPAKGGWQLPAVTVWVGVPLDGDVAGTAETIDRTALDRFGSDLPSAADLALSTPSVEIGPAQWLREARVVPVTWRPIAGTGSGLAVERSVRVSIRFAPGAARVTGVRMPDGWEDVYSSVLVNYEQARAWRGIPAREERRFAAGENFWTSSNPWIRVTVSHPGIYAITASDLSMAGIDVTQIDPQTIRLFTGTGLDLPENKSVYEVPDWMHEIAIDREGAADGTFDPQDRIVFRGLGPDGWYADFGVPETRRQRYVTDEFSNVNTYWMTWGPGFADPPIEWGTAPAGTAGAEETNAWMRLHFEKNQVWDARPRQMPGTPEYDPDTLVAWEKWHWSELVSSQTEPRTQITMTIPDPVPEADARLLARFWGANWSSSVVYADHYLRLDLGGTQVAETSWEGILNRDIAVDSLHLASPTQQLGIVLPYKAESGRQDRSYLGWVEVDYRRNLIAHGDSLEFWVEPGTAPRTFAVSGLDRANGLYVLDTTDPARTTRVRPDIVPDAGKWRAIWTVMPDSTMPRHFLIADSTAARSPGLRRDDPPGGGYLRQRTDAVDYIIITHPDLMRAADDLKTWRSAHGPGGRPLSVAVVSIQDIYDEFSNGRCDPTAIRNFLRYAYEHWNGNGLAAPPSYVLYLGDASYDFRNRMQIAGATPVPTYEGNYDPSLRNTVYSPQFGSDDWFLMLDPLHSPNLFMASGRLPAESQASAQAMIDKIKTYESASGTDRWRQRFTLVADDICQGLRDDDLGFIHMGQTEDLLRFLPDELERVKVYLYEFGSKCEYERKPAAATALRHAIDDGTLVVNYTGHGSEGQLADERVLETSGVASMSNADRLFFFLTASCSVGKFDFGGEGLGEALVRQPGGGAIGVFSSTAVAFSSSNAALNQQFYRAAWPAKDVLAQRPLGKIAVIAKEALGTQYMLNSRRYPLLGDPAVVLSAGRYRFDTGIEARTTSGGVTVSHPDSIFRGAEAVVSATVKDSLGVVQQDYTGDVDFEVYDSCVLRTPDGGGGLVYSLTGAPIFRGRGVATNGRFEARFIAPSSLRTGSEEVRGPAGVFVHASDAAGGGAVGSNPRVVVPEIPPEASPDADGPVIHVTTDMPLEQLPSDASFHATLDDSSGINITQLIPSGSVLVRIEQGSRFVALEDIAPRVQFPESFQHGVVDFTLPSGLEAGKSYRLILEASDNRDHRSQQALDFTLAGGSEADLALARAYNVPNPADRETTFFVEMTRPAEVRIDVFTSSGRIVRRLRPGTLLPERAIGQGIRWDLRDEDGDPLGNGVYFYKVSILDDRGESRDRIERLAVLR